MIYLKKYLLSKILLALVLTGSPLHSQNRVGIQEATPVGKFFNGVFPSGAPGSSSGFTTVNAFPNLRFIGPLWLTPYPNSNDLVLVGKAGHVWRFENKPDVTPAEVTVMLNYSKYGNGVDSPANVLPDGDHEPAVVNATPRVPSAPDVAFYQVVFHPNFGLAGQTGENHLYACYSYLPDLPGADNEKFNYVRLSRFTIIDDPTDGPIMDPSSELVLIDQYDRDRNHQGGAMFFGPDGFLYLTTGDGGYFYSNNPSDRLSQRIDGSLQGGILRIDVNQVGGATSHPIRRHPDDSTNKAQPPTVNGFTWPASFSGNYNIPSDNPFVDANPNSDILEEYWAIGLRSPHTMHYDSVSGQIWIGDVGGGDEEMHLATVAGNFGWDYTNGGGQAVPNPLIGINQPATLTLPSARCVIGGYVYRGTEFPELTGKVLFGDHVQGTVSAMTYVPGQAATSEFLCDFSRTGAKAGLGNFCPGPNGEVFMADLGGFTDATDIEDNDGTIQKLARAVTSPEPPQYLSQTGAFLNMPELIPHPSLVPYGVLSPLWSDGAIKKRWIALPNDGTHDSPAEKISFSQKGNWVFPAGTVIVKHFELPLNIAQGNTTRLETRFIICTEGGDKYGVTYRWLPDQSDAVLLTTGETGDYQITDVNGTRTQTWPFPSRNECIQCHNETSGQALGVRTHQLNGYFTYPGGTVANQLLTWSHLGMFDTTVSPAQASQFLQASSIDDPTVPVEHRVRSYLDANCSHCHRPGASGGYFDARLSTALLGQNLINVAPDRFQDLGMDSRYVKPLDVAKSVIHYRMDHALPDNEAMPPIAKNVIDADAVQAVMNWIGQLAPSDFPSTPTQVRALLAGPNSATGDFYFTAVFDDDVSGLASGDFVIGNGTILELQGSDHHYLAKVRPSGNPVTVQLPANQVTGDNTAVNNTVSNLLSVSFSDSSSPVAQFIGLPPSGVFTTTLSVHLEFGKAVTGLSGSELTATNASIANLTPTPAGYSFDLVPGNPGGVTLSVAADAVMDSFNRGNAASSTTLTYQLPDGDGDGLADQDETTAGSNPNLADSDGDGLSDGEEVHLYNSSPTLTDSDGDGLSDGAEVFANSDPNDISEVPAITAPASLVAYYNFDEGSGDTAFDGATADGAQNAIEEQGIRWTTTQQLIGAGALDLSGSGMSLLAPDPLTPGSTQALSMSVWVDPDSNGGYKGIFAGRDAPGNWGLNVESTHLDARIANTSGSSQGLDSENIITSNSPINNGWFHLAITWETTGTTATATAYLNGQPYRTSTNGISLSYVAPTIGYFIGDDPCCNGREFNGRIDDLAVFEEALSPAQIKQIYDAGLVGLPAINSFQNTPFSLTRFTESLEDDQLTLEWISEVGATYTVLTSTDPSKPMEEWEVIYNEVASDGFLTSFKTTLTTDSTNDDQRFFSIKRN